MARKDLKDDDHGDRRRGAFLGFGSMEALAKALTPKHIPDEVGAEDWKRICERMDAMGDHPDEADDPENDDPQSEPAPESEPASLRPTSAATDGPAAAGPAAIPTLSKLKIAVVVLGLCGGGSLLGGGRMLAAQGPEDEAAPWRSLTGSLPEREAGGDGKSHAGRGDGREGAGDQRAGPHSPAAHEAQDHVTDGTGRSRSVEGVVGTVRTTPLDRQSKAPARDAHGAQRSVPAAANRLLARMRSAAAADEVQAAVALAEAHGRSGPDSGVRENETRRIAELVRLGRIVEAEALVRAVVAAHPEKRDVHERALADAITERSKRR